MRSLVERYGDEGARLKLLATIQQIGAEEERRQRVRNVQHALRYRALAGVSRAVAALTTIAETARWYADNAERLPQEVDHALCVEVLSIAEDALDSPANGVSAPHSGANQKDVP